MGRAASPAAALVVVLVAAAAWPGSCQQQQQPLPVLVPVTKDPSTSLYTIPVRLGADLVVDLAGPLVWSMCAPGHLPAPFSCKSSTCGDANAYAVPGCPSGDCGKDGLCRAHPYNPVTGACAAGSLVHSRFIGNTTDGTNPVSQVSVRTVEACAPNQKKLLAALPPGAKGVAGLAGSGLALPAQVAASQKVARKFLLCLPRKGYGDGVAIFGGGPLHLLAGQPEYTKSLEHTPLVAIAGSPAYHVSVKSIALDGARVPIPPSSLAAGGGVVLCTRTPYTLLRPDVHRPFAAAFQRAMAAAHTSTRAARPVAPFKLCYDAASLVNTLSGYLVPSVTLALAGGSNWTMTGTNTMVDARPGTACLAFVEMAGVKAGDGGAPAVLVGGFQMENFVLEFDLDRKRLGFLRLPVFTGCGHFNFTKTS